MSTTRGWRRLVCLLPLAGAAAAAPAPAAGLSERFERDGLAVEATVSPIGLVEADQGPLRAGEAVTVRFRVSDRAGKPLTGAFPNGWMVARDAGGMGAGDAADADGRCRLALRRLLTSRLQNQAEVDLDGFAVLALNEDGTISVIDPLGGFAGTRLIGLVRLSGVGEDWARLAGRPPEAEPAEALASSAILCGHEAGTGAARKRGESAVADEPQDHHQLRTLRRLHRVLPSRCARSPLRDGRRSSPSMRAPTPRPNEPSLRGPATIGSTSGSIPSAFTPWPTSFVPSGAAVPGRKTSS